MEAFHLRLQGRAEALFSEASARPWGFPGSCPLEQPQRLELLAVSDSASEDRRRPPACPGLSCQEQERQEQAQSLAPAFLEAPQVVFSLAFQVLEPQVLSMRPHS